MSVLTPFIAVFDYTLQPIPPFTWFGSQINTLDVLAAFRLAFVLRQIQDIYHALHVAKHGHSAVENISFLRRLSTTLIVVYGGESVICPMLGVTPSFMISGAVPALFAAVQATVDFLPFVPPPSWETELPLAILDGFSRSLLLCNLIPPAVLTNSSPAIASSPWSLLLSSLVITNGGIFLTNLFSFLKPTPLALGTPPELLPYGWTSTDLWSAPLITALYALLTHAQPFWAEAHTVLAHFFSVGGAGRGGGASTRGENAGVVLVDAVDPKVARAACAALLAVMFVGRAVKNFRGQIVLRKAPLEKAKTQ